MPTVLITGANRGLGFEFARQYAQDGWRVLACCRAPETAAALNDLAKTHDVNVTALDVADFAAIDRVAVDLSAEAIDVLINNAGIFGPKAGEHGDLGQSFGHIDYDMWAQVLLTNTFAPVKMAEAFIKHIAASEQKKIVTISSVMGMISDAAGGYYAYGSSKAAVNRAMVALAKDVSDQGIAVALFCPGWVKTDLGGPQATLSPETSIAGMRQQIAALTPSQSGTFHRYNGDVLPW